mgnify:CR=1 FL=1
MRCICYVCQILYNIKEPFEDYSITHGLCPECFKIEMAKLDQYKENGIDPWKKVDPEA